MTLFQIALLIDVCNLRASCRREDCQYSDVLKDVSQRGFNEVIKELSRGIARGRASSNRNLKGALLIPTDPVKHRASFICGPRDGHTEDRSCVVAGSVTFEGKYEYLLTSLYMGLDKTVEAVYVYKENL